MTAPSPHTLARAFATQLHAELGDQLATVNTLNTSKPSSICHSHDFCDANQVMLDAWASLTGSPCDYHAGNEAMNHLITAAWDIAKAAQFNRSVLLALELYHAGHRITRAGTLADPAKRLVPGEIHAALQPSLPAGIVAQAVHMVHVWSLDPAQVGRPHKL